MPALLHPELLCRSKPHSGCCLRNASTQHLRPTQLVLRSQTSAISKASAAKLQPRHMSQSVRPSPHNSRATAAALRASAASGRWAVQQHPWCSMFCSLLQFLMTAVLLVQSTAALYTYHMVVLKDDCKLRTCMCAGAAAVEMFPASVCASLTAAQQQPQATSSILHSCSGGKHGLIAQCNELAQC